MSGEALIPVFAGPSLPPAFRPDGPYEWRPPAAAGDVLQFLDSPPAKLCLVDGYFDSCPAPWHKELLLLMSRGTRIFGAASMGALRAAELHRFGMIGVGAIYRAYAEGRLTGDDEVALIHGPERIGWAPLSVPMVEVRATLLAARRAGIVGSAVARTLGEVVREIHFVDRDWPLMEKTCLEQRLLSRGAVRAIRALHVPLKRLDALACLKEALAPIHSAPAVAPPPPTCFIRALAACAVPR